MEEIKYLLKQIKNDLGFGDVIYSGRSSEINHRVAVLMGQKIENQSPKDFYEECAKLAKREDRD